MWVFYLVVLKPTCCAGGIVKRCLWSEYAAVIFGKTTAQQNPPQSPFRKGGRYLFACEKSHLMPPFVKVLQGFQWVELQDKWDSDTKLHYLLWPLIKSTSGPKL